MWRGLTGSTAEGVVREATVPVLVLHQPLALPIRRVLLTTDLSGESEALLERGVATVGALSQPKPLRHIGLYAYRAGFLRRFPALPPSPLEAVEALEQLRVLAAGERIAVHVSEVRPGPGVDTPQDLERVRRLFA